MSIRSNIEDIMQQIENGDTALGNEIQAKSLAAIAAGSGTQQWQTYMAKFSTSPAELARLLPIDGSAADDDMNRARTYLVGNGPCGAASTGVRLIEGVWDILDQPFP